MENELIMNKIMLQMNIYGHGDTITKLFTLASPEVQTCMCNFLLHILTWLSIRYLKSNISKRKKS